MIRKLLVVCTGNVCRSPMAVGLFRQVIPEVLANSAGISALVGHGADPIAVQVMAEAGIDISSHRARMLTDAIARDSDIILVMDELQKQQLSAQYPYTRGKVFLLAEAEKRNIPDPFMQTKEVFFDIYLQIEKAVKEWAERINRIG